MRTASCGPEDCAHPMRDRFAPGATTKSVAAGVALRAGILVATVFLALLPGTAWGARGTLVASGTLLESCDGKPEHAIPFTAFVHIPRVDWADVSQVFGSDLSLQRFQHGVIQTLHVGRKTFSGPAEVELIRADSFSTYLTVSMNAAAVSFVWLLQGGGEVYGEEHPAALELLARHPGGRFWIYATVGGASSSSSDGCSWTSVEYGYPSLTIESVSLDLEPDPSHLRPPSHSICAATTAYFFGDSYVHDGLYPGHSPAVGLVKTGGRLIALDDSRVPIPIAVGSDLIVDGNAEVGGGVVGGSAYVVGNGSAGPIEHRDVGFSGCVEGFDLDARLAEAAAHNDNAKIWGIAGFDGFDLELEGETVELPPGRYYFRNLRLRNGSSLLGPTNGVAEIYVARMLLVSDGSSLAQSGIRRSDYSGYSGYTGLVYGAAHSVVLVSGARLADGTHVTFSDGQFVGHLVAPLAPVFVHDSWVAGSIAALELEMSDTDMLVLAPTPHH